MGTRMKNILLHIEDEPMWQENLRDILRCARINVDTLTCCDGNEVLRKKTVVKELIKDRLVCGGIVDGVPLPPPYESSNSSATAQFLRDECWSGLPTCVFSGRIITPNILELPKTAKPEQVVQEVRHLIALGRHRHCVESLPEMSKERIWFWSDVVELIFKQNKFRPGTSYTNAPEMLNRYAMELALLQVMRGPEALHLPFQTEADEVIASVEASRPFSGLKVLEL